MYFKDELFYSYEDEYASRLRFYGIRAMIADNNSDENADIKKMLESYGVNAYSATSSEEAGELYHKNEYDIIFVDTGFFKKGSSGIAKEIGENKKNHIIIGLADEVKEGEKELEVVLTKPIKKNLVGCILSREFGQQEVFDFTT